MNKYEHLLYKRGFLLTDFDDITFKDSVTSRVFKKWNHIYFNNYHIYLEPSLQYSLYRTKHREVLVMGLLINPFKSINSHVLICKQLAECKDETEFLEYLDEISGRFTIIDNFKNKTQVYGDAGGTRTIYYDKNHSIVSSHSHLIADLMNYKASEQALSVMSSKEFTGRKYLPGLLSPFNEIRPLTPNTRYTIEDKLVERFFPRRKLSTSKFNDTIDEVTNVLRIQSKLIHELYKTSTSLTAGLDSRLTFAIQSDNLGDKDYFTHISNVNPISFEEDVKIGKKLAEMYNEKHTVYEYSTKNMDVDFKEFKSIWLKNVGMYRGSVYLFKTYADNYPSDRLHIRSNLAEIVRVYYKSREGSSSLEKIVNLYTKSDYRYNPLVIKSFKEFINIAKFDNEYFYNYNFADLFYWEHRMGMWHSWIVNESDVAYETFVPFNNRKLLKMMLSIPEEERYSDELFIRVINNINPDLMDIPVNKKML